MEVEVEVEVEVEGGILSKKGPEWGGYYGDIYSIIFTQFYLPSSSSSSFNLAIISSSNWLVISWRVLRPSTQILASNGLSRTVVFLELKQYDLTSFL